MNIFLLLLVCLWLQFISCLSKTFPPLVKHIGIFACHKSLPQLLYSIIDLHCVAWLLRQTIKLFPYTSSTFPGDSNTNFHTPLLLTPLVSQHDSQPIFCLQLPCWLETFSIPTLQKGVSKSQSGIDRVITQLANEVGIVCVLSFSFSKIDTRRLLAVI